MKLLDSTLLANAVNEKRKSLGLSQQDLGDKTGINRIMIGRIEKKDYIPSVQQLQSIGEVLELDIAQMFVEDSCEKVFSSMRKKDLCKEEEEDIDNLYSIMLFLRQQIILRSALSK